jgi:hypothetical protein
VKPVCVPCQRFFRMKKSGFYFLEGMPVGPTRAEPGTSEPEKWRPYKIWAGDKWECHGCGAVILSGFGREPVAYQHEEEFTETAERLNATQFQVNDC